jgi:hypothetical protein
MYEYQAKHPPVHVLVAAYMGIGSKPKEEGKPDATVEEAMGSIGLGGATEAAPQWMKDALDGAEKQWQMKSSQSEQSPKPPN